MPVILVAEREGAQDKAAERAHHRYLVVELVSLVRIALADALHLWLVGGVDLVLVIPLLVDHPDEDADLLVIAVVFPEVTLKLTQLTTRNHPQFAVCLFRFLVIPGMVAETLFAEERLELARMAPERGELLGGGNILVLPYDLLQQFRVCRVCHVLLLDRRADDDRVKRPLVVMAIVDGAFLAGVELGEAHRLESERLGGLVAIEQVAHVA